MRERIADAADDIDPSRKLRAVYEEDASGTVLEEMDAVMPWAELLSLVEPHYSKGETDRKLVGLSIMLRVYFLQQWFSLSDPAAEDALYESAVLRRFAGIDLGRAPAPDETTILNFRHLLEEHELCGVMLDTVNRYLESKGIRITTGTIVDATIIHAPSSTKNEKKERDPEMRYSRSTQITLLDSFPVQSCNAGASWFQINTTAAM